MAFSKLQVGYPGKSTNQLWRPCSAAPLHIRYAAQLPPEVEDHPDPMSVYRRPNYYACNGDHHSFSSDK